LVSDVNADRVRDLVLLTRRGSLYWLDGKALGEPVRPMRLHRDDLGRVSRVLAGVFYAFSTGSVTPALVLSHHVPRSEDAVKAFNDTLVRLKDQLLSEANRLLRIKVNEIERSPIAGGEAVRAEPDSLQLKKAIRDIQSLIDQINAAPGTDNLDMATAITYRFGILAIMFFLAQILVSAMRYTLRLSYYYDGRADALELGQSMPMEVFERLVSTLSPDDLQFAPGPKSPIDQVADVAKTAVSKLRPSG